MQGETNISPVKKEAVVASIGILSLETIINKLPASHLYSTLNTFYELSGRIILQYKGHAQIAADKVHAFFPKTNADDAIQACLDLLDEFKMIRKKSPRQNPLKIIYPGIGISTGEILEANMGYGKKKELIMVGDVVWKSDKLQKYTEQVARQFLLDETVKSTASYNWFFQKVGVIRNPRTLQESRICTIDYGISSRPKSNSMIQKEIERYLATASL